MQFQISSRTEITELSRLEIVEKFLQIFFFIIPLLRTQLTICERVPTAKF